MKRFQSLSALALAALIPAAMFAQQSLRVIPVGTEFHVNSYTTGVQEYPAVSVDAVGNFVVVWDGEGSGDNDFGGVFGQRFTSSGTALGTEFQVNTYTTSVQGYSVVTADAVGDFVVAWMSYTEDGDANGVFARRYVSSGLPTAGPFRVNSTTVGSQDQPAIAGETNGDFVVVWHDDGLDGSSGGIVAQRYASSGAAIGTEFLVNSYTTDEQGYPAVASDADGDFVVVWGDYGAHDGDFWGVFGQRYASSGAPVGTEFQVNTFTAGSQGWYYNQDVATDMNGNFVVVWGSDQLTDPADVFGQRYADPVAKRSGEFQVNTYTTGQQGGFFDQHVAADGAGNFLAVWSSDAHLADTADKGVFAQARLASGVAMGSEFLVNTYTTDRQWWPAVAANQQGDFVVVWEDDADHNGDTDGIFGQRYVFAYERTSQPVVASGSVTTGSNATNTDVVETTVTSPNAGTVTITERPLNVNPPRGYGFIAQQVNITAPSATASTPLRIVFEIEATAIPSGQNFSTIQISRDSVPVPNCVGYVTSCSGGPTTANPAPACVASRCVQGDADAQLTVLTSSASIWDFSVPCVTGFAKGIFIVKETVPGKETLIAKLNQGPVLTPADFGDPTSGEAAHQLRIFDDTDTLIGELDVDGADTASCGASDCWKGSGTGYSYKDKGRVVEGVKKILLKASASGAKILFKAKGGPAGSFPTGIPAALMSTSAVTLEFHGRDPLVSGCFATTLTDIKTQQSNSFKAK